ncbi:hypothetical protein LINPERHAP2_LOCUS4065, partial [Linum perenne]
LLCSLFLPLCSLFLFFALFSLIFSLFFHSFFLLYFSPFLWLSRAPFIEFRTTPPHLAITRKFKQTVNERRLSDLPNWVLMLGFELAWLGMPINC